ncbi:MAG: hypothetical protein JSS82_13025 [Bacteroidetes bacterium]|nr:hypothetical protein [Bacteroidota bacterium]
MNFEDIQKSWKAQQVAEPAGLQRQQEVKSRWEKQQRRLKLTNIGVTLAFIGTGSVMTWVYLAFHEGHSLFFGGSIMAMCLLMFLYLGLMWRGMAYKKERMDVSSSEYLDYQVKMLLWQRKVASTYSQYYSFILWACLMLYGWDVTAPGTIWFKLAFFGLTSAYIFGMLIYVNKTKRKRQLKSLDALIADLRELKGSIVGSESREMLE